MHWRGYESKIIELVISLINTYLRTECLTAEAGKLQPWRELAASRFCKQLFWKTAMLIVRYCLWLFLCSGDRVE